VVGIALSLVSCLMRAPDGTEQQAALDVDLLRTPAEPISFNEQVKPILDQRCVVCHGCYDAPCQLKLSSYEGLERGANPQKVYDGARILPADPTRLFVDAKTTRDWRGKGFTPFSTTRRENPRSIYSAPCSTKC
jgi:hypothetical protein